MFGILAMLEDIRIGLFLIPPFGATLTVLMDLPEAPVAQPYAVIAGSVIGASVGTLLSLFSHGALMAIVAAVTAFCIINLIHAYHPPGVALAMYPFAALSGSMVSADSGPTFYCRRDWLCDAPEQVRSRMAELSEAAEQPSENGIDRILSLYP